MRTEKLQFTLFALTSANIDGTQETIQAYTSDESVAKQYDKQSQWFSYHKVNVNHVYHIIDSLDELADVKLYDKREAALSKLTIEERKLLGLG